MPNKKTTDGAKSEFRAFAGKIGGKDSALAIFETGGDLAGYIAELAKAKFIEAKSAVDFCSAVESGKKVYAVADKQNYKWLYDIAAQYPTGAISAFDEVKMEPVAFNPDYARSAALILISRDDIKFHTEEGMDILPFVGMSFVK